MAPGSLLGFLLGFLLVSCVLTNEAVSKEPLEVSPGQTVTLPCTTTEKIQENRKTTVEWEKNGFYVVVFRSGQYLPDQDDHFKNRAEMADPELKNGNLSLILRNIQLSDSGTYDCFFLGSGSRKKRSTDDLITSVTLKVKEKTPESQISLESETGFGSGTGNGGDQAETGERTRLGLELTVGLAVFAVFAVVLFVHVFPKFRTRQSNKEPTESSDQSVRLSETE